MSRIQTLRMWPIAPDLLLGLVLIGLDVVARLLPHALNFTPFAASALFAAAVFRVRGLSFAVPLIAMALSDCVVGFYDWRIMSIVYLASAVPAGMALYVGRLPSPVALASLSLTSSLVFFVSTNFAVWAFGTTYSHDLTGLLTCYVAALPFFKNTLGGDLFWTCVLFGGHRLFLVLRTTAATRVPERVTAA